MTDNLAEIDDVPSKEEPDIYCPHCGSDAAHPEDDPIIENNRVYLPQSCHMCESTWLTYYDCKGYKSLNTPPEYAKKCEDCTQCFSKESGRPYKYEPSVWLCDDCHDSRMEDDDLETIQNRVAEAKEKEVLEKVDKGLCRAEARILKGIEHMADIYGERRTDVSDMCHELLAGKSAKELRSPESRYVNAVIDVAGQPVSIFYDTLTTLIEYNLGNPDDPEDWQTADCDYRDDD